MATLLPEAGEAAPLAPRPDSVVWRVGSDARGLAGAGTALLLQVAHPTVAAGVREHSDFRTDPWGRLLRTLDYVYLLTYGGPAAAARIGRQLREMHKPIKGVAPGGDRYHALEPEAYAWVHATLAEVIVAGHARFMGPLGRDEIDRLWEEWLGLGRLLGVRERDLPGTWDEFDDYVEAMIATRLEENDVVHDVLDSLAYPNAPIGAIDGPLWRLLRAPAVQASRLSTVGLLRPSARHALGVRWSPHQERALSAMGAASRAATPLMPSSLRISGPLYLRWRRQAIESGPFARAA